MAAQAVQQTIITPNMLAEREQITPKAAFEAILEKQTKSIGQVAARHISASRLIQIAVGASMRNPLLFQCEAITIVRALLQAAELGLEVGAAQEAHLVPFNNNKRGGIYECQLLIDFRGLLKLVWQSQLVASVDWGVVYMGDDFTYKKGTEVLLDHSPNLDRELPMRFWPAGDNERDQDGEPVGQVPNRWSMVRCVYAAASTIHGGKVVVVLTRSQVERYRGMSRAKDSNFWVDHWEAMATKTALRQLCKVLPKSSSLAKTLAMDDAVDSGDFSGLAFDIPEANVEIEGGEPRQGMAAAKSSLKEKLGENGNGKSAEDLAALIKWHGLGGEFSEEIQQKLSAFEDGPSFDEFLAQAKADNQKGFSKLLTRLSAMKAEREKSESPPAE